MVEDFNNKKMSIGDGIADALKLSWDSVMEHEVRPKVAKVLDQLFTRKEAKDQAHKWGTDALARKDDLTDAAYSDLC